MIRYDVFVCKIIRCDMIILYYIDLILYIIILYNMIFCDEMVR